MKKNYITYCICKQIYLKSQIWTFCVYPGKDFYANSLFPKRKSNVLLYSALYCAQKIILHDKIWPKTCAGTCQKLCCGLSPIFFSLFTKKSAVCTKNRKKMYCMQNMTSIRPISWHQKVWFRFLHLGSIGAPRAHLRAHAHQL